MLDLYLSELRRFRNSAIIYGIANLLALVLVNQLIDLATNQQIAHLALLLLYALSGLGFAAYQFGSYRQPSRWIWLLHRPLHRMRILAALALAAVTLIALAMALPLFIVLATQDHFTSRVIDTRHYAGAAWLALSTLSAWLAGAYIVLHRSRLAFVILVLPLLLTMHLAAWPTMLALALACNAVLLLLVATVFRPNRYTGDDLAATAASALPLQAGFYLAALWAGSMLYQVALMLGGAHPLSSDPVPRGGITEARRADRHEIIRTGLAGSSDPRAGAWRANMDARVTASLGPTLDQFAVRNLITTRGPLSFLDGSDRWTYSHDRMMYRGQHLRTRADLGWLGAEGKGRRAGFDAQPFPQRSNRGGGYLMTAHDLYDQLADGSLRHVLHVEGSEQLGGGIAELGGRMLLLTNRRVVMVPADGTLPSQIAQVALPRPFGELERADAAQVADGILLSFVFGLRQLDGVTAAPQVVYLIDQAGLVREVGRRELTHDFAPLFEHKDWWLSPALHALVGLPAMLIEVGMIPDDGAGRFEPLLRARPIEVWMAAVVAALLSASVAAWWTRRAGMTARSRMAWCAVCLLVGLPALLSLMVLQPRRKLEPAREHGAPLAA